MESHSFRMNRLRNNRISMENRGCLGGFFSQMLDVFKGEQWLKPCLFAAFGCFWFIILPSYIRSFKSHYLESPYKPILFRPSETLFWGTIYSGPVTNPHFINVALQGDVCHTAAVEACTRTADAWRHAEVLLQMVGSLAVKGLNHPEKLVHVLGRQGLK